MRKLSTTVASRKNLQVLHKYEEHITIYNICIVNIVAAKMTAQKYSPRGAHSTITSRDLILSGSYFCDKHIIYILRSYFIFNHILIMIKYSDNI